MALRTYCTVHGFSLKRQIDVSWAVPYSPRLSIRFQSHLNADPCLLKVGGPKHIFKYVCKVLDSISSVDPCRTALRPDWIVSGRSLYFRV